MQKPHKGDNQQTNINSYYGNIKDKELKIRSVNLFLYSYTYFHNKRIPLILRQLKYRKEANTFSSLTR